MKLDEIDHHDLKHAVYLLEQATLTEKMTTLVGNPIDYLMAKLPKGLEQQIHGLVTKALHKATDAALWSLDNEPNRPASTKVNKLFAALSGSVRPLFQFSNNHPKTSGYFFN